MPNLVDPEDLVSLLEAAAILKISRQTLYKRISQGKLRPIPIGVVQYLKRSELEKIKPVENAKSEAT